MNEGFRKMNEVWFFYLDFYFEIPCPLSYVRWFKLEMVSEITTHTNSSIDTAVIDCLWIIWLRTADDSNSLRLCWFRREFGGNDRYVGKIITECVFKGLICADIYTLFSSSWLGRLGLFGSISEGNCSWDVYTQQPDLNPIFMEQQDGPQIWEQGEDFWCGLAGESLFCRHAPVSASSGRLESGWLHQTITHSAGGHPYC